MRYLIVLFVSACLTSACAATPKAAEPTLPKPPNVAAPEQPAAPGPGFAAEPTRPAKAEPPSIEVAALPPDWVVTMDENANVVIKNPGLNAKILLLFTTIGISSFRNNVAKLIQDRVNEGFQFIREAEHDDCLYVDMLLGNFLAGRMLFCPFTGHPDLMITEFGLWPADKNEQASADFWKISDALVMK